ncbi:methionine--tRNA ligase, mitochondrial isoform X2 [Papilio machaon]|uniref:methionine--tRNA ligase, mitochondrial isoform X2 n=1 Tax=Papilio machaon TaxID=76193 RepID=UPI001E6631DB|nr:methionine--tRNA ligase, mitochondrial isoform X2 [Papilio machaon]
MRLTIRLLSSVARKRPFYVTTPIFYVNAAPHLGHLYSALVADAVQRFEKLTNPDCNIIFSTGTDEHGTKIQQAAAKANLSLSTYCDKISQEYRDLFRDFNINHTDFIRTTEDRHKKAVAHFWKELVKRDYIYKAKYSGWYSVNDEAFIPETHLRDDIVDGEKVKVSIESGHSVEWTEETNYMFRLSAFKTHLQNWLKTDGVVTPSRFQKQLLDYLDNETYFPDISVSRPSSRVHWAIRVPGDDDQSIYVWLDALINYLSVIGYPDDEVMKSSGRPWPADVQVVGKDILKFHGIYWPAFLMAAGYHPPRRLLCHAHWTVDGIKMSKSLGNVVNPRQVGAPPSALRYLLLREATMSSDANFSETKLINIANAELADTLGNLAARCAAPALNNSNTQHHISAETLSTCRGEDTTGKLMDAVERLPELCHGYYSNYQFYKAADAVIHVLHLANLFFETQKPWELKKKNAQNELDTVLYITTETLRICAIILQPLIPDLATQLLDKLQVPQDCRSWQHCETPSWTDCGVQLKLQPGKFVLFQRIYIDKKAKKINA